MVRTVGKSSSTCVGINSLDGRMHGPRMWVSMFLSCTMHAVQVACMGCWCMVKLPADTT